jgi:hypothetical protein
MEDFLGEIFASIIGKMIGYALRTPGACILWLQGGCKRDFSYYTDLENYGYVPHFIGIIFYSTIIALVCQYS